mmetsp:Transcript_39584/g.93243  ORF Transcript_39584/g.93243 Transcript_39584/m.93243 type:complete len:1576 (-) Transcript_39584:125-4852(-)
MIARQSSPSLEESSQPLALQAISFEVQIIAAVPGACNEPSRRFVAREALHAALQSALPRNADGWQMEVSWLNEVALSAEVQLRGVSAHSMPALRDAVLSGEYDLAATAALVSALPALRGGFQVMTHKTRFAEEYESTVLSLDTLTAHQQEKLGNLSSASSSSSLHLKAPAGAGKTFVALHHIQDRLQASSSERVLFVARNEALACFAATWLVKRLLRAASDVAACRCVLQRLHILYEPFDIGVSEVVLGDYSIELRHRKEEHDLVKEAPNHYSLVAVDEAHHVYADPTLARQVEAFVTPQCTRRLLLSDLSQSLGRDLPYPDGCHEVVLSEVIRCSQRIVAGAMAFQLGGDEKLLTKCHHESTGPPLKSYLFDLEDHTSRATAYAEQTMRALAHVRDTFPGLSLHNRLAILVPDATFLQEFKTALRPLLEKEEPCDSSVLKLVTAAESSAMIGPLPFRNADQQMLAPGVANSIIVDTLANVDGLERLIVIAVGLDCPINQDADATAEVVETRSMLYRALTRAQLMAVVVNEFLRSGWLEFLGSIRLRKDEAFNSARELRMAETAAVDDMVRTEVTSLLTKMAKQDALKLPEKAMTPLVRDVVTQREKGQADLHSAVAASLDAWKHVLRHAEAAVAQAWSSQSTACQAFNLEDGIRREIVESLALDLYQGTENNIVCAASQAIEKQRNKDLEALAKKALDKAIQGLRVSPTAAKEIAKALQEQVKAALQQADHVQDAFGVAEAAVADWARISAVVETQLEALINGTIGHPDSLQLSPLEQALLQQMDEEQRASFVLKVTVDLCQHGGPESRNPATAIRRFAADMVQEARGRQIDAVFMERLPAPSARRACFGCRVAIQRSKERNGLEGIIEGYSFQSHHWTVRVPLSQECGDSESSDSDELEQLVEVPREKLVVLPGKHSEDPIDAINLLKQEDRARQLLKKDVLESVQQTATPQEIEELLTRAIPAWQDFEAKVFTAFRGLASEKHIIPSKEVLSQLTLAVLEDVWLAMSAEAELPQDLDTRVEEKVRLELENWCNEDHSKQAEEAEVATALEAAASAERLLLNASTMKALQERVFAIMRRGEELAQAVSIALTEWQQQLMSRQVQQSVWDPSGNQTTRVTGMCKFMPFKRHDPFDYHVLAGVFPFLHFHMQGELARVCKRWHSAARDPSWKPELIAYAWGSHQCTGLEKDAKVPTLLGFSIDKQIVRIICSSQASFALTAVGQVWFWGHSWLPGHTEAPDCEAPTLLEEMQDIVAMSCSPAGYFHGHRRAREAGLTCAAVGRKGQLYTWGNNAAGQLLHQRSSSVARPRRVQRLPGLADEWDPSSEPVSLIACGLRYVTWMIRRRSQDSGGHGTRTSVFTAGTFLTDYGGVAGNHGSIVRWEQLEDVPLRQLVGGGFHCCALTTRGELYTMGHPLGQDSSNGNLLGLGRDAYDHAIHGPTRVAAPGMGPIAEVACSSYSTIAIAVDGRVFSWGDADGNALGHETFPAHVPSWIPSLRAYKVTKGSLSYTNAAVATDKGRLFVWGGGMWEGGIAQQSRGDRGVAEVRWGGVPDCYMLDSAALAHSHGFLIFRKHL